MTVIMLTLPVTVYQRCFSLTNLTFNKNDLILNCFTVCHYLPVVDGGGAVTPPPLRSKIFLISCIFLGKPGKFVCWRPLLEGWRPLLGESWIRPCLQFRNGPDLLRFPSCFFVCFRKFKFGVDTPPS